MNSDSCLSLCSLNSQPLTHKPSLSLSISLLGRNMIRYYPTPSDVRLSVLGPTFQKNEYKFANHQKSLSTLKIFLSIRNHLYFQLTRISPTQGNQNLWFTKIYLQDRKMVHRYLKAFVQTLSSSPGSSLTDSSISEHRPQLAPRSPAPAQL